MAFPGLRHALVAVALCRVVEGCECWWWWNACACSPNLCTCAAPAPAPAPAPRPAPGSTGTNTSEISTAAIGKGRGREKAGNRTRRLEALWPAIAGPGKVCTPGDPFYGNFDPSMNVKPNQFACQEWAVSRGRSVYVWGTNNGCQSCGTTNTRDGWGGYSVYQEPSPPTGTEMWFMNCDADTDASHHAPVCKRD